MDISTKFKRSAIATAVCAALLAPAVSIGGVLPPLTAIDATEQQVNTSTLATFKPVVATDADGDFVMVWSTPPSTNCVITARKYNADGSPASAEIPVSSYTTSCYTQPDVAMDADGDFVVAWTDFEVNGTSSFDVLAQRYDSAGTAQGSPIQVATSTSTESDARVAMDADGDFAVAWREFNVNNSDLYFQRYDSSGTAQGVRQPIHTFNPLEQVQPDIAMDADGDLIAVWNDNYTAVKARIFPAAATAGTEFSVTTVTTNAVQPRVAADADGDFIVSWKDSFINQLLVRGFDKSGTEAIPQTFVATLDVSSRGDVAMDADGDFALSWGYWNTFVTPNVIDSFVRRFDRAGTLIAENQFNSSVDGGESSSSIAMDADGDIVVVWEPDYDGTDGGNDNSYFRRYQGSEDVDLAISTNASPDPVPAGGSLTYTATVTNNHSIVAGTSASQDLYMGEVGAATGVTLTDTLPSGSSYVSASGTGWNCSEASGTVSCNMDGSILPTSNSSVDITVTAPGTVATLSNSATVAANQLDTDTANNSDTLTTAMCNDYGTIALSAATASVAEDGTSASLTVSRSGGSCGDVSVDYASADGTAIAGADYTATSGTLSWAGGDSTDKTITIPVIDDTETEWSETLLLTLSNPSLATLGSTTEATVTITYNDLAATDPTPDPTTDPIPTSGGGGAADPWWLMLAGLPLLRRRRR